MLGGTVESQQSSARPASLSIIVPLALERRCLSATARAGTVARVSIFQSGQGAANARRAALAAIGNGATALLSIGVAGALGPGLEAGDVIVPESVIDAATGNRIACAKQWAAAVHERISGDCPVSNGALLTVAGALTTPARKRAFAQRYGAVACDMESAAVGAVAAQSGADFLALRVVSDSNTDELPDNVEGFIDDTGNARILPVIGAMMSPRGWRSVITMNTRFRLAQRRLNQLSDLLAPSAWFCPGL